MRALCVLNGHGEIVCGMPYADVNSRLTGHRHVCVPFADWCSVASIGDDAAAVDRLRSALTAQYEREGVDLEIRGPLHGTGHAGTRFFHHVLPLGAGPEALLKGCHKGTRSGVNRARREGVVVERASDVAALDEFYRLHLMTRRRLGVPIQPKRFVRRFVNLFENGRGFVLLARSDGEVIAAALFLVFKGVLTYKYSATNRAHARKYGNNALLMEAIRWGCEHGCTSFDMGRTDLDGDGLAAYKRSWGAEERILGYTRLAPTDPTARDGGVPPWASMLLRKTPPLTTRLAGAALYRHFA